MTMHVVLNQHRDRAKDCYPRIVEPQAVHQLLPGYAPTPLVNAPQLARRIGIGRVSIKNESVRLGLPSFKILGASYAAYRALAARLDIQIPWDSLAAWRTALAPLRPLTLATATDGNHGRAVAYLARILDLNARIFVPQGTVQTRIEAIAGEGAEVVLTEGSYDEAVARAAQEASAHCLVIADTAWAGYEDVPRWVIDGYSTILNEIDATLDHQQIAQPDLVAVQIGVGALASAVVRHYRQPNRTPTTIIGVEPTEAACVFDSVVAGRSITLLGVQHSIMAGLNCGTPSPIAWPVIAAGLDLCVAIDDAWAYQAMRELAQAGVIAGESGAAGLAGILALAHQTAFRLSAMTPTSHLLVITTEGATDPDSYAKAINAYEQ